MEAILIFSIAVLYVVTATRKSSGLHDWHRYLVPIGALLLLLYFLDNRSCLHKIFEINEAFECIRERKGSVIRTKTAHIVLFYGLIIGGVIDVLIKVFSKR